MRPPRILQHGAKYHVTAQANREEMIFTLPGVPEGFLAIISRAKKRYSFSIENFCVMGNHIHLIIRPHDEENLSAIMQWILCMFAKWFNKLFHYRGHLWRDRFFSRIIASIKDFLIVSGYIDNNPIKAGIALGLGDWEYCGASHGRKMRFDILDPPP